MNFDWTEVALSDVANMRNGAGIKQENFATKGIPLIRVTNFTDTSIDLSGCGYVEVNHAKKWKNHRLHEGDVIVATVGSWPPNWSSVVGKTVRVPLTADGALQNQNTCCVTAKEGKADQRFLYYTLRSEDFMYFAANSASGSANQARLPVAKLENFKFELPSLCEQKEISNLLGALDDRITLLRETNTTLEAIAQSLFKSWFVDFDPVRAKQQGCEPEGMDDATATLFPNSFEESELGLLPKGWRASTLDEISTVGIGKTPPRKEQHWFSESPNDVRWVSIRDMGICGSYISTTSEYLTAESIDRFNVRRIPDNTVMLSFKMTIGRVAISEGEMTTNEAIAHFKLDEQSPLSTEFIYLHLKQFDYSTLSSTSSIADAVNSKIVKTIPILLPTKPVIISFQNKVASLFQRIKNIEQQLETLSTLRDTLLPRLISGQLRLPENKEIINEAVN